MSKEKLTWLGVGILVGIVFRSQVDKIPLINRVPSV
jgi:hypothetical protein